MLKRFNITQALQLEKNNTPKEEQLLLEAKKILIQGRLTEKYILSNLKFYNSSFDLLDDEAISSEYLFTQQEIKITCKKLRLRFLPSQAFEGEIPYASVLKIKELNYKHQKELKHFKILSTKK